MLLQRHSGSVYSCNSIVFHQHIFWVVYHLSCLSKRRNTYLYPKVFRKKKCKQPLENKGRQRLSRNKRKREQKKQVKAGLVSLIKDLKEENKCIQNKVKVEMVLKRSILTFGRRQRKKRARLKMQDLFSREDIIKCQATNKYWSFIDRGCWRCWRNWERKIWNCPFEKI